MPDLVLPNDILQDTAADAVQVQQNYSKLEQYINDELINRDGSVAMVAQLQLVGDPTGDQNAATKAYVDALMPVGVIMIFGGAFAPAGQWALCNGASLSTSSYPVLHSVLGYRYGGSGGTFSLPNFTARMPVGVDASQTRFNATGKTGGSTVLTVPQHLHPITTHTHTGPLHTHTGPPHAHTYSATTSLNGTHEHNGDIASHGTVGGNAVVLKIPGAGVSQSNVVDSDGIHAHSVSGTTATEGTGATGASGTGTTSAGGATSTGNTGTAGAEHLPPFVVVQYIIRIDQT